VSPRGSRCPAGLTRLADPVSDTHRWNDKVGGRESASRRPLFRRRPRMGGNRDRREPGGRKIEACAAPSIEWARRRDLQFDTAKTEAALYTRRGGHKKHLRPKLTPKIKVGEGFVQFNNEATRWLLVWMDAHLTFKNHHNRCMKKARAPQARLRLLTKIHGIIPDRVRAVQMACIQAVA
jgi:hypothetical protein